MRLRQLLEMCSDFKFSLGCVGSQFSQRTFSAPLALSHVIRNHQEVSAQGSGHGDDYKIQNKYDSCHPDSLQEAGSCWVLLGTRHRCGHLGAEEMLTERRNATSCLALSMFSWSCRARALLCKHSTFAHTPSTLRIDNNQSFFFQRRMGALGTA